MVRVTKTKLLCGAYWRQIKLPSCINCVPQLHFNSQHNSRRKPCMPVRNRFSSRVRSVRYQRVHFVHLRKAQACQRRISKGVMVTHAYQ